MSFGSDNQFGVHPKIMAAIANANNGFMPSYGEDDLTKLAKQKIAQIFETNDLDIYFVTTGGAANCLALGALTPNWGAIMCDEHAHIAMDEGNGPQIFTGGARLIGIKSNGKIMANDFENELKNYPRDFVHGPQIKCLSITNLNENGLVYWPHEIAQISQCAQNHGLYLHCDGARFANALCFTGANAKDLSWANGIDVLSFGLTKNGAMIAEAVIFFGKARNEAAPFLRKSSQQLISKHRFLAAQFLAMLEDNLWLKLAQNANNIAQKIGFIFQKNGLEIIGQIEGNEVFVRMNENQAQKLMAHDISFYPWQIMGNDAYRFVGSWAHDEEAIIKLANAF